MNISKLCWLSLLLLGVQSAWAATGAVSEMAGMLMHLEHYPSAAEKSRLHDIAASKNSSAQEKVVANALANLKHSAADDDKAKLKQVKDDATASAEVRELAGIILNLNHMPSAADKSALHKLMK